MTAEKDFTTTQPQDISWRDCFRVLETCYRAPAWTRVATEAQSLANGGRKIMKKIGVPTRPLPRHHFLLYETMKPALTEAREQIQDANGELPCSKRPRMESFTPCQGENETVGSPASMAEMASLVMHVKVDLANRVLATSTATLVEEIEQFRTDLYMQVIPAKRRLDRKFHLGDDGLVGGHRLRSYDMIWPLLSKAAETGDKQIDIRTASIAQISANLQEMRPDPRRYIALQGIPELSDITDVTEPEGTLTLVGSPQMPAETKSPTKREVHPAKPISKQPRRLSDTMVRLLPGATPNGGPSPTKSSSPSTSLTDTPAPRKIVTTSPTLGSPASASSVHAMPAQQASPTETNNKPKVFRDPSYDDSSSSSMECVEQSSHLPLSPSNLSRPVAPTPSKWDRLGPSSPNQASTPHSAPPGQHGPEIGLLDVIPVLTPRLPPSTFKSIDGNDSAQFDFGMTSPSFNSPCWLGSSVAEGESRRNSGTDKSSRRKSEPLIRSCYRNQATARQSMSPRKLVFHNDVFVESSSSSAALRLPPHLNHTPVAANADDGDKPHTPEVPRSPDIHMGGTATPAISWAQMTGRTPPSAAGTQRTPRNNRNGAPQSAFAVDMRQNPDIFGGAQASSGRRTSAIDKLAQMAKESCDGQANVVVREKNGRLLVRFKLPVKYASKFPESQSFDESRFTTTPSAISSSPRITFKGHYMSMVAAVASPSHSPAETSAVDAMVQEQTMVVADFALSPPGRNTTPSPSADEMAVDQIVENSHHISMDSTATFAIGEHTTTVPWLDDSGLPQPERDLCQNESALSQPPAMAEAPHGSSADTPQTPTMTGLEMTGLASSEKLPSLAREQMPTPVDANMTGEANLEGSGMAPNPTATSSLAASFAPTNQAGPLSTSFSPRALAGGACQGPRGAPGSAFRGREQKQPVKPDGHDSPGRAYMREFIKRSKPKPLSATESGSPMAPPAKRQPLGAKNSNAESPQKGKRKAGIDEQEGRSWLKQEAVPASKRSRRHGKMTPLAEAHHDMEDPATTQPALTPDLAALLAEGEGGSQGDEDMTDVLSTRRSSRLRSQKKPAAGPKSSIPTPIMLGGRSGAGRNALAKKTGQQEVTRQTRSNTRKNKGDAEYPAQVLAKKSSDEMEVDDSAASPAKGQKSKGHKCVGWKDPLELHEGKPPRGRSATAKAKATQGETSIAKPTRASAAMQKRRTARVAANLGMSANGTPAKAGRVTRSSIRAQK